MVASVLVSVGSVYVAIEMTNNEQLCVEFSVNGLILEWGYVNHTSFAYNLHTSEPLTSKTNGIKKTSHTNLEESCCLQGFGSSCPGCVAPC